MKVLLFLLTTAVTVFWTGCVTSRSASKVNDVDRGGTVLVESASLSGLATDQNGHPLVRLAITNSGPVPVVIHSRAILVHQNNSWERDFRNDYYFVGTQLSSPEVPSIASSLTLPAGEGGFYSLSVPPLARPFQLELFCASQTKNGRTFYVTTPVIGK